MADINNYTCTGRLGANPECRTFPNGDPVVNLRIAVDCSYKDRDGNRVDKTLWMPVKITNKGLCRVAEAYLSKGSRVGLSGRLEARSYDKDGQTHWVTELVLGPYNAELVMLDSAPSGGARDQSRDTQDDLPMSASSRAADPNDEIPF